MENTLDEDRIGNQKFLKDECLALNSSSWEWKLNELLTLEMIDEIATVIDLEIEFLIPKLSSCVFNLLTKRIIQDSLYCGCKKGDEFISRDYCLKSIFDEIEKIHVVLDGQLDPDCLTKIQKQHVLLFVNGFGKKVLEMIKYKKYDSQAWKDLYMDDLVFLKKKILMRYGFLVAENVNYKLIEKMIGQLKIEDKFNVVNDIIVRM